MHKKLMVRILCAALVMGSLPCSVMADEIVEEVPEYAELLQGEIIEKIEAVEEIKEIEEVTDADVDEIAEDDIEILKTAGVLEGNGTPETPYLIADYADLMAAIEDEHEGAYYKLCSDIYVNADLNNPTTNMYTISGNGGKHLYGNNNVIYNMYLKQDTVDSPSEDNKLYSPLNNFSDIQDLTIDGVKLEYRTGIKKANIGAVFGDNETPSDIKSSCLLGDVLVDITYVEKERDPDDYTTPTYGIGGFCAYAGRIDDANYQADNLNFNFKCSVNPSGYCDSYIGGIAARSLAEQPCNITNSKFAGKIETDANVIAGIIYDLNGSISDCETQTGSAMTQLQTDSNRCYLLRGPYVAGFVGIANVGSTIENCVNSASISSEYTLYGSVAGIVAEAAGSTIKDCKNSGNLSAHYVAGIMYSDYLPASNNYPIKLINCHNYANIDTTSEFGTLTNAGNVAGIIYKITAGGEFKNCVNHGDLKAFLPACGFASQMESGERILRIEGCGNEGNVKSTMSTAYGFASFINHRENAITEVNEENAYMYGCYNEGDIEAPSSAANAAGCAECLSGIAIDGFINSGNVTAGGLASGIANYLDGVILKNSTNTGNISAGTIDTYSGTASGIAYIVRCDQSGDIKKNIINNCANRGNITGNMAATGLINTLALDYAYGPIVIENCYNSGDIHAMKINNNAGGASGLFDTVEQWRNSPAKIIIKNVYNVGAVSSDSTYSHKVASFIRDWDLKNYVTGTIEFSNVYVLEGVPACPGSDAYNAKAYPGGHITCTREQMKQASTFKGFDFDEVWEFDPESGYLYPVLQDDSEIEATITFDADGGSVSPAMARTNARGYIDSLPTPVKDGYTFVEWRKPNGSAVNTRTKFKKDTTIKAKYALDGYEYEAVLDPKLGSVSVNKIFVEYNKTFSTAKSSDEQVVGLVTPYRDGYSFEGWFLNDEKITNQTVSKICDDGVIIVARWKQNVTPGGDGDSGTGDKEASEATKPIEITSANEGLILDDEAVFKITSVDPSIVLVKGKAVAYDSSTGIVRAIKKGSATLYYLDGKKKIKICKIKVEAPKLKTTLKLKIGKSKKLKLSGTKIAVDEWESSDPEVASVSGGIVSAKAPGSAVITAKIGKHEYKCDVIVK